MVTPPGRTKSSLCDLVCQMYTTSTSCILGSNDEISVTMTLNFIYVFHLYVMATNIENLKPGRECDGIKKSLRFRQPLSTFACYD